MIGFVGTGTIAAAIVTGLSSGGGPRQAIRLSPRNATVAAELSNRFDNVVVCSSNQEVLDTSDTIVLAVRPQVAENVLSELRFPSDRILISLVPGLPTRTISKFGVPAGRICRAIPLPSVAQRKSPIAVYPPGSSATQLFSTLGHVFEMQAEDHLNAFNTVTSTMAAYFGFVGGIASWAERKGIAKQQAREYLALMFAGLADAGLELTQLSFEDLAVRHATPGGLNEQVLRHLTGNRLYGTLDEALDSVHRRATGH